ncbi:MAG: ABA4-like family protein [Caldilineaceae bacterium]
MEMVFQLSNLLVMPFWVAMIMLPHWRWTQRIMQSLWVIAPAALLYAILIIPIAPSAFVDLMNPTLTNIANLLSSPQGAAIGWVHFLAFDLFVGRWAYLDSRRRNLSAWLASPILFFILMFGPLGYVLYFLVSHFTFSQLFTHSGDK